MPDDAMNRGFLELNDRLEAVRKGSFAQDKPTKIHFRFDASIRATANCALAYCCLFRCGSPSMPFKLAAFHCPCALAPRLSLRQNTNQINLGSLFDCGKRSVNANQATRELGPGPFVNRLPQLPVAAGLLTFLLHIGLLSYPCASSPS